MRNLLTEMIADKLTGERKVIAERFEAASILFTDIVRFSSPPIPLHQHCRQDDPSF